MIDLRKNEQGFTLVELSIVLVIIGLIVGGILIGQDMINASKSRATVAQIEKYNAAVNTFNEKFGGIPGDYEKASVNLIDSAVVDGDGNGVIYSDSGAVPATVTAADYTLAAGTTGNNELPLFFQHLSAANMIDGSFDGSNASVDPGTNFPQPKTGSGAMLAYSYNDGLKYWFLGLDTGTDIAEIDILRPDEAFSIDKKMDDGKPLIGIVKSVGLVDASVPSGNSTFATAACVNVDTPALGDETAEYKINILSKECQLRIRMN